MENHIQATLTEIVLFQFRKADRSKIYAHAKRAGVKIIMVQKEKYLLAIYQPPKRFSEVNAYLDEADIRAFHAFLKRLRSSECRYHYKVYSDILTQFG